MEFDIVAGVIQLNSTPDYDANLGTAERLVRSAAADGAQLIVLPELFPLLSNFHDILAAAEPIDGPTSQKISRWAAELGVTICGGSICEQSQVPGRGYNTSLLFGDDGTLLAHYRKIHLFHVDMQGQVVIRESDHFLAGEQIVVTDTKCGRIAQAICYDLRFPELFRQFADELADIVVMPSAFTKVTGQAHWHTLVASRAIENQMYVIAPNQAGRHTTEYESFGHSLIIDPWGEVLAEGNEHGEDVLLARLSSQRLVEVRSKIPALRNRRLR